MNAIHKINAINQKELDLNVLDDASWHSDYKDTAYIYIGNLHQDLKESDILKIFSQYGNPSHINLVKDKDTGKLRGFCYLKYEDQRSCILAVDNFNGTKIYERPLRVDHTYYKLMNGQVEDDFRIEYPEVTSNKSSKKEMQLLEYVPESLSMEQAQLTVETENADTSNTQEAKPAIAEDDDFSDPMAGMLKKVESPRKRRKTKKSLSGKSEKTD